MGKKKPTSLPYEQNTSYTEWRPSETADLAALRAVPDMPETLAPSLQAQYDRARQRSENRLNSAYAQNIPQTARLAMMQNADRDYLADYGTALNQAAFDANNQKFGRRAAIAEMTLGKPLQTKSYGYQSQMPQGGGWLDSVIGGAAGIATKFI